MITIGLVGSDSPEMTDFIEKAEKIYNSKIAFLPFRGEDLEKTAEEAAVKAAQGEIHILMKGIIPTKIFLKALLKEDRLIEKQLLTHVAVIQLPKRERLILLTDAAMNIAPSLTEHKDIIEQAIEVAQNAGLEKPKVALLSSAEHPNPKMPSAVRAAELTKFFQNRKDAVIYGPLSLDLALSKDSVEHKNFTGPIAGDADILVVPTIDAGNVLYKAFQLFGGAKLSGLLTGAAIPVVVPSRNDSVDSRFFALDYALTQIKNKR